MWWDVVVLVGCREELGWMADVAVLVGCRCKVLSLFDVLDFSIKFVVEIEESKYRS